MKMVVPRVGHDKGKVLIEATLDSYLAKAGYFDCFHLWHQKALQRLGRQIHLQML